MIAEEGQSRTYWFEYKNSGEATDAVLELGMRVFIPDAGYYRRLQAI